MNRMGYKVSDIINKLDSEDVALVEVGSKDGSKSNTQITLDEEQFYQNLRSHIVDAQKKIYAAVNAAMVLAYWQVGADIHAVCGDNDRAPYGKNLLKTVSDRLSDEFGKGFDITNLRKMHQFYRTFPDKSMLKPEISWSHYRLIMRVPDEQARSFYLRETVESAWSVRQLQRQINTMFYERLLSSRDKESVAAEIESTVPKPEYEKIIHDPYVLEFLELEEDEHYFEGDLEEALLNHLQKFLMELGRGYTLVGRQVHIPIGKKHFHLDLLFYNILMRCYVLIDLKTDELTHDDIGQMQMYVNYYTREKMNPGDNKPIGLLLCPEKDDMVIEYTLPEDNDQIFAAKYLPYLPTKEELRKELNLDDYERLEG